MVNLKNIFLSLIGLFVLISCGTEPTPTYTLNTSVNGEGQIGYSVGDMEKITISGGEEQFDKGESVTLTALSDSGWVFSNWEGGWSTSDNPTTITMNNDISVIGVFDRRDYPLQIEISGEGTVNERIVSQPKVTDYPYETVVELTPISSKGWEFVEWTGDVSSQDSVIEIFINQEKSITVNFQKKSYQVDISIEGNGSVEKTIIQSKKSEYEYGTIVQLNAIPDSNWIFKEWGGDISGKEWNGNVSETDKTITIDIEKDLNVIAIFHQPSFYIARNGVTVICDNAEFGESATLNGVTYTKRTKEQISQINVSDTYLSTTCTSGITEFKYFFDGGTDADISSWDVSNVTHMYAMFIRAGELDVDLTYWDVSSVESMSSMFSDINYQFVSNPKIGDITNWDVSNVEDMGFMFRGFKTFNQPIGKWDVSSVTNMWYMFEGSRQSEMMFNQPLDKWDVSNVENMDLMFFRSTSFNQDISTWCVSQITSEPQSFSGDSPLTEENKPKWGTCPSN